MTLGHIDPPGRSGFDLALEEGDMALSILIHVYKDGTLEYSLEHNHEMYGEGVPIQVPIKALYSAAETIIASTADTVIASSKESDNAEN